MILCAILYLTLSWPAGHVCPTHKESFQVRWDSIIPLFLHAAICLEVSLFRWTSQNSFSRETAVYKWYCVQFLYLTLSWPAGHVCPTYKESFQVRWDNSIPLFLHAAIYLEVSLFRWTSQNKFCRVQMIMLHAALHTVSFVHGKIYSDWFNGIVILQGRWQHGEKVGYCYPSGLEKTLYKWDIRVSLITKRLTVSEFVPWTCFFSPTRCEHTCEVQVLQKSLPS